MGRDHANLGARSVMDSLWNTIIGAIVTIVVAYITSNIAANANIKKNYSDALTKLGQDIEAMRLTIVDIKVWKDIMSEIYIMDALRDARKRELVQENSPLRTTNKWSKIFPERLTKQIEEVVFLGLSANESNEEIQRDIVAQFGRKLYLISVEHDISVQALWGSIRVFLEQVLERESKKKEEAENGVLADH